MARAEYEDIILSATGKPVAESPVSIKVHPGAAGSNILYQAEEGSASISALKTNKRGVFNVWLEEGRYDVTAVGMNKTIDVINQASVVVGSIGGESIMAKNLAPNAVETAKIKNEAVTKEKLSAAVQVELVSGNLAKEESLGEVSGAVTLDLLKAEVFRATVKGAATFEFINIPVGRPIEADLYVTQDGVGGHLWTVKSIEWVNGEPAFSTLAGAKALVPVLILTTGAVIGFGGAQAEVGLTGKTSATLTALGSAAGTLVSGAANTVVGVNAGEALTSAEANTALGASALVIDKTGNGNTALGRLALNKQTGAEATAVGYEALSQSTASFVTAVGSYAGASQTTATGTTAVGHSALFSNKTAANNTAVGANALEKATAASNTAVGSGALSALTLGSENVAVGRSALAAATEGKQNTALGRAALSAITTGEHNTAVGQNAGGECITGTGNVFIGFEAGKAEAGSNKLYIHNSASAAPLILGNFEAKELTLTPSGGKVGLYGVAPTARQATIAEPAETTAANTKAIKELIAAAKKVGLIE